MGRSQAPVLMMLGTSSSVGKSTLAAGLCRWLAREGVRVAPFKAQNMSNNAAVCADGGEIGRAQYVQALAAGLEPSVDMNPVLLKPQSDRTSQVVVHGRVARVQSAADYFGSGREQYWPAVVESLARLRADYELVIAEGAGSPAEINLRHRDIANLRLALHAQAEVLLVGDIDLGGVFASLLGTWEWMSREERGLLRGFVLNKFRGDPGLLHPAPALLQERTGVAVTAVVPYVPDLDLPEEDAATLGSSMSSSVAQVEVAVVRLPHVANFDEFAALSREQHVSVRFVDAPDALRAPDLVILPGTKSTIPDLLWLHERGLADRLRWLARTGTPVLGVCGGYQMLGRSVRDPLCAESTVSHAEGIGLLDVQTEIAGDKRTARVEAAFAGSPHPWDGLQGIRATGYEIHMGQTWGPDALRPLTLIHQIPDGAVSADAVVAGTYVHGLLEGREACHALVRTLAARRGFAWRPGMVAPDPLDRLADVVRNAFGGRMPHSAVDSRVG